MSDTDEKDCEILMNTPDHADGVDNDSLLGDGATKEKLGVARDTKKAKRKKKKKRANESSVVYVSRIPPGMDVGALRARLSRLGTLGRVWLQPEDKVKVAERRNLGGRRQVGFTDGWVEFNRRKEAKKAVALLNGNPMNSTKRGGRWGSDLWVLKLLPRDYSWQTLVAETGVVERERILRVKAAVAAGRREKQLVEEREALAKRISKRDADGEGFNEEEDGGDGKKNKKVVRRFKQREAVDDMDYEEDVDERRAREASRKMERGESDSAAQTVDSELVHMLFGKN